MTEIPPMVQSLLRKAAQEWIRAGLPPGPAAISYSTSANEFLWEAERAWFEADEDERPAATVAKEQAGAFCLYRLYDDHDRLLYVGVSCNLPARLRRHKRKLGDLLHHYTWEEHPNATSMLEAEREAVATEYPALNRNLV